MPVTNDCAGDVRDLQDFISRAFYQSVHTGCSGCLNELFWNEYERERNNIRDKLIGNGVMEYDKLYDTLWHLETVKSLYSLGWRGGSNYMGCVEFRRGNCSGQLPMPQPQPQPTDCPPNNPIPIYDSNGNWTGTCGVVSGSSGPALQRPVKGCMDPTAVNYAPEATMDDGSCKPKPVDNVLICYGKPLDMVDGNRFDSATNTVFSPTGVPMPADKYCAAYGDPKDEYSQYGGYYNQDPVMCDGQPLEMVDGNRFDSETNTVIAPSGAVMTADQYCSIYKDPPDSIICGGEPMELPVGFVFNSETNTVIKPDGIHITAGQYCVENSPRPIIGTPPFIEELFPIGSVIEYNDGGVTIVTLANGDKCRFSPDDLFILMMVKESNRDQKTVNWSSSSIEVYLRDGTHVFHTREELNELVLAYHSFWDKDPLEAEVGITGIEVTGEDGNKWRENTPMGYQMSSYVFSSTAALMNGVLGKTGAPSAGTGPLLLVAETLLQFINWSPNPEGRPGQGQDGFFDKCGNQIGPGEAYSRAMRGEIVYQVDKYGGEPTVYNIDQGGIVNSGHPITDYGCYYAKLELKHPEPRALNHPELFRCGR